MKIKFEMIHDEVHGYRYITSNNHSDYVLEEGDKVFRTERNGDTIEVTLQTGMSFLMGDYNLPDPEYGVYMVTVNGEEVDLNDIEESDPALYEAINDLHLNCWYDSDPVSYLYDVAIRDDSVKLEKISYIEMRYNEMREKFDEDFRVCEVHRA